MNFLRITAIKEFIFKGWIYLGNWKSIHGNIKKSDKKIKFIK